jgi:hypothetical protein
MKSLQPTHFDAPVSTRPYGAEKGTALLVCNTRWHVILEGKGLEDSSLVSHGLVGYEHVTGVMHPRLKVDAKAFRLILGLAFFATVPSIEAVELSGLSRGRS